MVAASEIPIQTVREGTTALDMANAIFGDGVTVLSASYTGDIDSAGIFSDGDNTSPFATPSDTGVILSTGNAESFTNSNGQSNQSNNTSTNTSGPNNDALFNASAGRNTFDAAYLDVDFTAVGNVMTMQFVFASEEYPEFVNSIYQDFVGVWINGSGVPFTASDQVELSIGDGDTDPGNINNADNQNLYLDNTSDAYNTEMDGVTITLKLTIPVSPGTNSIRIGIADVGDNSYDSSLLIAGDSAQTALVAVDDETNLFQGGSKTIDILGNDVGSGSLSISKLNDEVPTIGVPIPLNTGQTITLNADGTITVTSDGDLENFNFTYEVSDGTNDDVGFVKVTTVPCFVEGTLIETAFGPQRVESLQPDDLIKTRDHGYQPLRWIGMREVPAEGKFAPIRVSKNTFGSHDTLLVSPEHRILIEDAMAELLFGEAEVLVAAKNLVNDTTVRPVPGGMVTYIHLMFDEHQVIYSQGLATESFLPGPQTTCSFEEDTIREISTLFPELDLESGSGYSQSARRTLRRYEADLWRAKAQRAA